MGTRHLTCVIKDGDFVVAQYGQWDGYPDGQGRACLEFLHKADLGVFREKLGNCFFADEEDVDRRYKEILGDKEFVTMGSKEEIQIKEAFPYFSRNYGAEILSMIYRSSGPVELRDNREFALDSLFCEWAWVIDLDRGVFECYGGFNESKDADNGVFSSLGNDSRESVLGTEYYPVCLVKSYPLDNLPETDDAVKEIDELTSEDDE